MTKLISAFHNKVRKIDEQYESISLKNLIERICKILIENVLCTELF